MKFDTKYGPIFGKEEPSDLQIELFCFRTRRMPDKGGLGPEAHFKNASAILWNKKTKEFKWHPWAEDMLEAACNNKYLGIIGSGSSGKCTSPETPIMLLNGRIKKAREILVGDVLMGDDHSGRNVLSINSGRSKMVEIIPQRGMSWKCNDDHVLTLSRGMSTILVDISVKNYLNAPDWFRKEYRMVRKYPGGRCQWFDFKIQELADGDWSGFTLDGNGRFILGDFTVTHNTDFAAIWSIISWLSDPLNTMVLVTSTSLKDSRHRIWGSICEYYMAYPGLPGKLVDSIGMLRIPGFGKSDKSGITLIAGEKKREKESIGKLIGFKNENVIMVADELPELSEALLTAAYSNLSMNPKFQLIGIGNFNSMYDPLGIFVTPKGGYGSITPDDTEWETERGKCIRFDGLKSPNLKLEKDIWPIYGREQMKEHRRLGETTAAYWRMCRSFPCPAGEEFLIYSEADILSGKAMDKAIWQGDRTRVAFLDPGFTNEGDDSALIFGWFGRTTDGLMTLAFDKYEILHEDISKTDETRSKQIASQFRDRCLEEGVKPNCAGYDRTGAGIPFGEIIMELWSFEIYGLDFGGAASETMSNGKPANEVYTNRVSEIWYAGVEFMRAGQIKGLMPEVAIDLKARKYETVKSASNLRIRVESKKEMKIRIGRSPGAGDAAMGLLSLCRERLGFIASTVLNARAETKWLDLSSKTQDIYEDAFTSPEFVIENAAPY